MATRQATTDAHRRLLDGLAEAIREQGLWRTQINDIVRNARVSKRTFYECFADKEACFAQLVHEWMLGLFAVAQAALDPEAPWEEQVDAVVDALLTALGRDPALAATISRELPAMGDRGVALQAQDTDRLARFVMEATRGPGMRRAGVEPAPLDTAVMLIAGISELLNRAARVGRPTESLAPTVKTVIKRVIGPPPQPARS
jgi:AcrR family transcriptional regulator